MRTLTKTLTAFALIGFFMTSCGGNKNSEMSLCDCYKLKDKYESPEEAEKAIGKEQLDKCFKLVKDAKEEDILKCK
jgi:hypothetical protein